MVLRLFIISLLLSVPLFFFLLHQKITLIDKLITVQNKSLLTSINIKPQHELPILSVDMIFSADHLWIKTLSSDRKRILIATGDVIPARSVNFQASQQKDFRWPYLQVFDVLKNADVTFINLETPLIDNSRVSQYGVI